VPDLLERLQSALRGRYEIERELGRGGMAIVCRCTGTTTTASLPLRLIPDACTLAS